uniref:Peptidase S26 domain-containing protein n=1 Tax=Attheya septentrionalis TaxID=420275 RepID=A0A6T7HGH5_9STRA|mmetsp:Transcript_20870/g.37685  ORF Transcript_20870/g.37685 Transcript_20870/m.37685 type:complete len:421 (+) Transcript_20870:116-1378(+)|eukprot:CAMPEP_0198296732 /NCGR_PEP_ID=MMETSP1449-20131203/33710_1 /TAXON_ID=420275 /ORGANISM="Attheya septentrionalis, Strain CCMP2084" /LENGTH=420 /DNA_ID=CAMNT_0043997427 /DNA_START=31 /DNA_END=1293 /DNA_ORIENTATION=+
MFRLSQTFVLQGASKIAVKNAMGRSQHHSIVLSAPFASTTIHRALQQRKLKAGKASGRKQRPTFPQQVHSSHVKETGATLVHPPTVVSGPSSWGLSSWKYYSENFKNFYRAYRTYEIDLTDPGMISIDNSELMDIYRGKHLVTADFEENGILFKLLKERDPDAYRRLLPAAQDSRQYIKDTGVNHYAVLTSKVLSNFATGTKSYHRLSQQLYGKKQPEPHIKTAMEVFDALVAKEANKAKATALLLQSAVSPRHQKYRVVQLMTRKAPENIQNEILEKAIELWWKRSGQSLIIKADGPSMEPTIISGCLLLSTPFTPENVHEVAIGDVVILLRPSVNHKNYTPISLCKRVAGLAGDIVNFQGSHVIIPKGHCWLLGDNASRSLDSRIYGAVPLNNIRRKVLCRFSFSPPSFKWIDGNKVP